MAIYRQYASGRIQSVAPELAAVSGGNLSEGTRWIGMQCRNRVGYNRPSALVQVNYAAGERIQITIPETALLEGEDWQEFIIVGWDSNSPTQARILARIPATVSLPHQTYLSEDAHVALAPVVASPAALPTGDDLFNGQYRYITSLENWYRYSSASAATVDDAEVLAATPGRWLKAGLPVPYLVDTRSAGGADAALEIIDPAEVADYAADGSAGERIKLWLVNDSPTDSGRIVPQGTRVNLRLFADGKDASQLLSGKFQIKFLGYADLGTGELDATMPDAGATHPYQWGKTNLRCPVDLPPQTAWAYEIYPELGWWEVADLLPAGAVIATVAGFYGLAGAYSEAGLVLGDCITSEGGRRRIVPDTLLLAQALPGSGIVGSYAFRAIGSQLIPDLQPNTADQVIAIDGNGTAFVTTTPPALTAKRAIVGTLAGVSTPINWSGALEVSASQKLVVDVGHPLNLDEQGIIRSSYPDVVANMTAVFNPPEIAVFVEQVSGGEIRRFNRVVSPDALQEIELTDWSAGEVVGSLPEAAADFGLYAPEFLDSVGAAGGNFAAGDYRVTLSYAYDGDQITAISHSTALGCIPELEQTLVEASQRLGIVGGAVADLDALRLVPEIEISPYQRRSVLSPSLEDYLWIPDSFAADSESATSDFALPDWKDSSEPGRWVRIVRHGIDGITGLGVQFEFSDSTSTNPPTGRMRGNSSTPSNITAIYLNETSDDSINATNLLSRFVEGTILLIQKSSDRTEQLIYRVTADAVDNGSWFTVPVAHLAGSVAFANTDKVFVSFAIRGEKGRPGESNFGLSFVHSTQTTAPPGTGTTRFNNSTIGSVTQVHVNKTDAGAVSVDSVLALIDTGALIQITDKSNANIWAIFRVSGGVSNQSTYRTISVTYLAHRGALTNNAGVFLSFSIAGPQGVAGVNGLALPYQFATATTGDPSSGMVRLNDTQANFDFVTGMRFHITDRDSVNWAAFFGELSPGSLLLFYNSADRSNCMLFRVNAVDPVAGFFCGVGVDPLFRNGSNFETFANIEIAIALAGNVGATGDTGSQGDPGDDGLSGWALLYEFTTETANTSSPGNIRYDNAAPASVTRINIDHEDINAADVENVLAELRVGAIVKLASRSNPAIYAIYKITGITSESDHESLAVTFLARNLTFANTEAVEFSFAIPGEKGDSGSPGSDFSWFAEPCRVATTANITLSGTQTIDGVSLSAGNRVLVVAQTDTEDNGVYEVDASTWSRTTDFDSAVEFHVGRGILVAEGGENENTAWILRQAPTTLGTDPVVWEKVAGEGGGGGGEITKERIIISSGGNYDYNLQKNTHYSFESVTGHSPNRSRYKFTLPTDVVPGDEISILWNIGNSPMPYLVVPESPETRVFIHIPGSSPESAWASDGDKYFRFGENSSISGGAHNPMPLKLYYRGEGSGTRVWVGEAIGHSLTVFDDEGDM